MDARGGEITWYLTANDADFDATTRRVRRNAKQTGDDVDREFKRGFGGAKLSLDDFRKNLSRSAQLFRDFQIALRGFELTSMVIGASIATGAIIELVGALTALGGLLFTVPAGVAAFAGAFSTLKIATGGIADAFKAATKTTGGMSAASTLARRQADIMRNGMKQDAALTERLTDLTEQYADTVKELAEERLRVLNETIMKGVTAWSNITSAARSFLDVARDIDAISQDVATAQMNLNSAILTYGASSVQAREATQALYEAQARLADANAELDYSYTNIKDNVRDLATNLNSLTKANRNEMKASSLNLKALRLEKQSRGENVTEIENIIAVLDELIDIKDTRLTLNPDLAGAQADLDALKNQFPQIAFASEMAASSTEESLVKSLGKISKSMDDVRADREELQRDLIRQMAELNESAAASAAGQDPFAGLSKNAKAFVLALIDVKNAFEPVKNVIQDNFFAGLDTEIRNIAKTSFPMLERGLGNIATAFNGMAKEASRVIQQPFFQGAVEGSLNNTATATNILTAAVEPLARVFTDLVNIGNPYVLMLSEWVVKQSELAAAFTGSVEGQKKMTDAINLGITALQSIGSLLGAIGGLFLDLFRISNEAGISFIGTLTEMINKVRDWLKTAEGQEKMQALFEATDTIFRGLLEVLGGVVNGILGIVKAYNDLEGPLKDVVTNLLIFAAAFTPIITYASSVASSLSLVKAAATEVGQALSIIFSGGRLVDEIGEFTEKGLSLNKVFSLIGKHPILAILGALAAVFVYLGTQTTVFQDAFKALQPTFDATWKALQPLFTVFGQLAEVLGGAIAQIVPVIAEVFGQILAAILPLIPPLLQLVMTLLPVLVTIIQAVIGVIQILMPIITFLAQVIGTILVIAVNILVGVLQFVIGVVQAVANAFVGAWNGIVAIWNGAGAFFQGLWDGIVLVFSVVGTFFADLFRGAWEGIKNIWNAAVGFFQGVWNGIVNIFNVVVGFYVGIFQRAWDGIKNIWNAVGGFFRDVWNNIVNAFSGAMNLGKNIVEGLWNGISNMVSWIGNKIRGFGESVLGGIKSFFGIKSPSRVMRDEVGKMLGLGIAGGIVDSTAAAVKAAKDAATAITDGFAMSAMTADLGIDASGTLSSQFAPAMVSETSGSNGFAQGVVINQTNEVHTDLDMDQVNRNLTWELNKL